MTDLRLDRQKSALSPTEPGSVAIVAGFPEKSELVRRITSEDPDEIMPPPDSDKTLTAAQKALIRRWIQEGADWNEHWAFVRPIRPQIPQLINDQWRRNAIDHFILARLDQQGWKPSPDADKEILIRRVTFDLTGLPPTLAEVDAFLADDSPDAYECVVNAACWTTPW
jgi:hypothetical protein